LIGRKVKVRPLQSVQGGIMAKVVNIDHIGIVLHNIEKSLQFWQKILGVELDYTESVPSMNLNLAWLPVNSTRIELLEPTTEKNNEYTDFLKERGPGMHHICLEVDDIDAMLNRFKVSNIKLKDEVAVQLPGRKLAFLQSDDCDGVIVELYELTPGTS
jgi:methylmalonyl-CoA/ethylmalonyl-CoA epimerase